MYGFGFGFGCTVSASKKLVSTSNSIGAARSLVETNLLLVETNFLLVKTKCLFPNLTLLLLLIRIKNTFSQIHFIKIRPLALKRTWCEQTNMNILWASIIVVYTILNEFLHLLGHAANLARIAISEIRAIVWRFVFVEFNFLQLDVFKIKGNLVLKMRDMRRAFFS